jgi:putative PIN family toxin of toxin-antitoxin system
VRVVLDTNVLLPALFSPGLCEALLDGLLENPGFTIVLSGHIIEECREHAAKFKVPRADMDEAMALILEHAEIVEPADMPRSACPDPDDLPVLGTAVAGKADVLVTGDKALLRLRRVHGIPILSPRDLYARLW